MTFALTSLVHGEQLRRKFVSRGPGAILLASPRLFGGSGSSVGS